jgi:hypothetical protein
MKSYNNPALLKVRRKIAFMGEIDNMQMTLRAGPVRFAAGRKRSLRQMRKQVFYTLHNLGDRLCFTRRLLRALE